MDQPEWSDNYNRELAATGVDWGSAINSKNSVPLNGGIASTPISTNSYINKPTPSVDANLLGIAGAAYPQGVLPGEGPYPRHPQHIILNSQSRHWVKDADALFCANIHCSGGETNENGGSGGVRTRNSPSDDAAEQRSGGVKFGIFNRKHHCRVCGEIFCASCSEKQVLGYMNSDAKHRSDADDAGTPSVSLVRCCHNCYHAAFLCIPKHLNHLLYKKTSSQSASEGNTASSNRSVTPLETALHDVKSLKRKRCRGELRYLPSNVLLFMLSYLPLHDLLRSASLISSDFYFLSRENYLWHLHLLHRFPPVKHYYHCLVRYFCYLWQWSRYFDAIMHSTPEKWRSSTFQLGNCGRYSSYDCIPTLLLPYYYGYYQEHDVNGRAVLTYSPSCTASQLPEYTSSHYYYKPQGHPALIAPLSSTKSQRVANGNRSMNGCFDDQSHQKNYYYLDDTSMLQIINGYGYLDNIFSNAEVNAPKRGTADETSSTKDASTASSNLQSSPVTDAVSESTQHKSGTPPTNEVTSNPELTRQRMSAATHGRAQLILMARPGSTGHRDRQHRLYKNQINTVNTYASSAYYPHRHSAFFAYIKKLSDLRHKSGIILMGNRIRALFQYGFRVAVLGGGGGGDIISMQDMDQSCGRSQCGKSQFIKRFTGDYRSVPTWPYGGAQLSPEAAAGESTTHPGAKPIGVSDYTTHGVHVFVKPTRIFGSIQTTTNVILYDVGGAPRYDCMRRMLLLGDYYDQMSKGAMKTKPSAVGSGSNVHAVFVIFNPEDIHSLREAVREVSECLLDPLLHGLNQYYEAHFGFSLCVCDGDKTADHGCNNNQHQDRVSAQASVKPPAPPMSPELFSDETSASSTNSFIHDTLHVILNRINHVYIPTIMLVGYQAASASTTISHSSQHPSLKKAQKSNLVININSSDTHSATYQDTDTIIPPTALPHKVRLVNFYKKYKPERLVKVQLILRNWKGREDELFATLVKKYGPEPLFEAPAEHHHAEFEASSANQETIASDVNERVPGSPLPQICITDEEQEEGIHGANEALIKKSRNNHDRRCTSDDIRRAVNELQRKVTILRRHMQDPYNTVFGNIVANTVRKWSSKSDASGDDPASIEVCDQPLLREGEPPTVLYAEGGDSSALAVTAAGSAVQKVVQAVIDRLNYDSTFNGSATAAAATTVIAKVSEGSPSNKKAMSDAMLTELHRLHGQYQRYAFGCTGQQSTSIRFSSTIKSSDKEQVVVHKSTWTGGITGHKPWSPSPWISVPTVLHVLLDMVV